ncbi:MFS transporter [Crossiella sp. NPDC003009]
MTGKQAEITLPDATVVRARAATTLFFALAGFVFASWAVRIPAVKEQVGASPAALGLALLALSAAAVATMSVSGAVCRRFGSRQVTVATGGLLSLTVVLPALTHSAPALAVALLVFGIAYGGIDVAVNSVAVELAEALRRPIMPSLHAANSIGSLVGAALGGLLAAHLSPAGHLLLVLPIGLLATVIAGRMLLASPIPRQEAVAAHGRARRPTPGVVVFGVIGLCAAYSQGGLDNWIPLHLTENLGAGAGLAAIGYAIVQGTMAIGRLAGTALVERFGQTRVVVVGGLLACAGTLAVALSSSLWLAFAGLVLTGVGLANIFPLAIAGAGALGGPGGVALAALMGYAGILLAPPTIGFIAGQFDLRLALVLIALLAALAALAQLTTVRSGRYKCPDLPESPGTKTIRPYAD